MHDAWVLGVYGKYIYRIYINVACLESVIFQTKICRYAACPVVLQHQFGKDQLQNRTNGPTAGRAETSSGSGVACVKRPTTCAASFTPREHTMATCI